MVLLARHLHILIRDATNSVGNRGNGVVNLINFTDG
ncbi:Uncharacterised protein [Vibrio cholerae]|nr:Uncharacterised protein [Vibrio cholerae]